MPHGQECSTEVIYALKGNEMSMPGCVTYETNGTQELSSDFKEFYQNRGLYSGDLFFSVSPKLQSVSGEKRDKAINPEIVREYEILSREGGRYALSTQCIGGGQGIATVLESV